MNELIKYIKWLKLWLSHPTTLQKATKTMGGSEEYAKKLLDAEIEQLSSVKYKNLTGYPEEKEEFRKVFEEHLLRNGYTLEAVKSMATQELFDIAKETLAGFYSPQNHTIYKMYYDFDHFEHRAFALHELSHSLRDFLHWKAINKLKLKHLDKEPDEYWDDNAEIFARLMELRYLTGLSPDIMVDENWIKQNQDIINDVQLGDYKNEFLIKMLNTVALVDDQTPHFDNLCNINNQTGYSKKGGKISYFDVFK